MFIHSNLIEFKNHPNQSTAVSFYPGLHILGQKKNLFKVLLLDKFEERVNVDENVVSCFFFLSRGKWRLQNCSWKTAKEIWRRVLSAVVCLSYSLIAKKNRKTKKHMQYSAAHWISIYFFLQFGKLSNMLYRLKKTKLLCSEERTLTWKDLAKCLIPLFVYGKIHISVLLILSSNPWRKPVVLVDPFYGCNI